MLSGEQCQIFMDRQLEDGLQYSEGLQGISRMGRTTVLVEAALFLSAG